MNELESLAETIRKARLRERLTQKQLAEGINNLLPEDKKVSRQWIVNLEGKILKKFVSKEREVALYKFLYIDEKGVGTQMASEALSHNILPLIKRISEIPKLERLSFEQFQYICAEDERLREAVGFSLSDLLTAQ